MNSTFKRWSDLQIAVFEQRILILVISIGAFATILYDRQRISSLEEKLSKKEFILAPGVTDFVSVQPQIIPDIYVEEFVSFLSKSLGSFSGREVKNQFKDLEKYMANDFRIQFRDSAKKLLEQYEASEVSEVFSPQKIEIVPAENLKEPGFQAVVTGKLVRFVSGLKVEEIRHVFDFSLLATLPTSSSPWALKVHNLRRLDESDYLKEKRG